MRVFGPVEEKYRDFATHADDSPCFAEWARGVAGDAEVQEWLATLPDPKQQPNLVFAAARWHGVEAPAPYAALREALLADDGRIRRTILTRATQTNEAGRMATLLPAIALAAEGRPVALLEAGASAGLCLFPDRWGYRWTTTEGTRTLGPASPALTCAVSGPAPLPSALPSVAWRGGIDLHPLDVRSEEDCDWLRTLVWPEHEDRRVQLETAIGLARTDPPDIRAGDILELLPDRVAEAGSAVGPDGVVVVFHSAVVVYLDTAGRERFAELMAGLVTEGRCHWISNEAAEVLPAVAATGPEPPPGQFVLGLDGRSVAHIHGHGRSLGWWG